MGVMRQRVIPVYSTYVNTFIVQGQSVVLIDTGLPGYHKRILGKMEEKGIKLSDVSLIILTHGHIDHFGSASVLHEKTGAPLAVHKADAGPLREGINPPLHPVGVKGAIMGGLAGMVKTSAVRGVEADILVEGEMNLAHFGIAGRIIPTPGHTPGSVSVVLEGGCVLVGDLIFGGILRKKAPGFPYFGDDRQMILSSIRNVLELNPKIIYAGHGGPFTADAVERKFFG